MANLLSSLFSRQTVTRITLSEYIRLRVQAVENPFSYAAAPPVMTVNGRNIETIEDSYTSLAQYAYRGDSVVAACMRVRRDLFRQAKFTWRELGEAGPGKLFRTDDLRLLERPWPNGTTGELLTRMITDVDLCGNSFLANEGERLRWLRPDWMSIVLSGDPLVDPEIDVLGYVYTPGGADPDGETPYKPDEICHWSPEQDPLAFYRGMSWVSKAIEDIQGDRAATTHKLAFFRNGATLGPIVRVPAGMSLEQFKDFVAAAEAAHTGADKAYKTMYVGGGAEVTLAAADFRQLDLKSVQGGYETRIAAVAGVHPVLVGLSEGLAGSSLNSGNFAAARRATAEMTLFSLWQDLCGALSAFFDVPDGAEMWIRERDIPFLREERKDQAEITKTKMLTIEAGVRAGYKPDALVEFAETDDVTGLKGQHTGLTSVQLLPPGEKEMASTDFGALRDEPVRALAWVDEDEIVSRALADAIDELSRDRYDVRIPGGNVGGGRFRKLSDTIFEKLKEWLAGDGEDDPLAEYSKEQLRRVAKERGLLKPRERVSEDQLKLRLYKDIREQGGKRAPDGDSERPEPAKKAKKAAPKARKAAEKAAPKEFDRDEVAEAITLGRVVAGRRRKLDRDEVDQELSGLNLAQLRRVATGVKLDIPEAGPDGKRWTRDTLAAHIADRVMRDRFRQGREEGERAPKPRPKADGDAEKAAPEAGTTPAKSAGFPSGSDIEVITNLKELTFTQMARGEHLTPAGRKALDSLGSAGHPRVAAIPDTEGKVREAYRMLAVPGGGNDHNVALADVRKLIGDQVPRADLDETLLRMARGPDTRLVPQSYARGNAATRIPAAVIMGGQEQNQLHIDDPTLARPSEFSAVVMAKELINRRSGRSGDPMMALISDADLQAEVDRRASRDPVVARDLAALPGWPPKRTPAKKAAPDLEQKARDRQSKIDTARGVADTLAELDQITDSEASAKAVQSRLRSAGKRNNLPAGVVDDLIAAAGDRKSRDAAVARLAGEHGLVPGARAGTVEAFDPAKHRMVGGGSPGGTHVRVVRPGYEADVDGERVRLSKATVSDAPSPTPVKKDRVDEGVALKGDPEGDNMRMHGDSLTMGLAQAYTRAGRNGSANRMMDLRRRATTTGPDGISPQQVVDELREILAQEQDDAFRRRLERAVEGIDAPMTPIPDLPANTPPLARKLMEDLHAIPYARKGDGSRAGIGWVQGPSLVDQLAQVYHDAAAQRRGDSGRGPEDRVRMLLRETTHESNEASFRIWALTERLEAQDSGSGRVPSALADELRRWERGQLPSVSDATPDVPGTPDLPADFDALTNRQKRARLRKLGFGEDQIDELVPLARPRKVAARSADPDEEEDDVLLDDIEDDEPELDQAARSAVLAVDFDDIAELERALGNQFKQYWLYGKGRAKWNTWTELYRRLIKHVGRLRARRIASQWFHSRFGFWSGDDKNRVRQGKPPRGDRIGPG